MKKIEKFDYINYILIFIFIISNIIMYFLKHNIPSIGDLVLLFFLFIMGLRPFLKEKLFIIIRNITAIGILIFLIIKAWL